MEKKWQQGTKKAVCKNCGRKIYLADTHNCWYHCNDDNDICRAYESINVTTLFHKAEPMQEEQTLPKE